MESLGIMGLDLECKEKVEELLDLLDEGLYVKVGMELLYERGGEVI
ncbi:hypothetical protein [Staphylococcus pettenkoferi]|nr:hypothetical protein [Staphylococcus pettenkoferi]